MTDSKPIYRSPKKVITEAIEKYHPKIGVACSFQAENSVIIDMVMKARDDVTLFAIDTGRLPEETLDVADRIRSYYGCEIRLFFPEKEAVQNLIKEKGFFSFRRNVENRKECCHIRKVEPIARAQKTLGLSALINGRRQEHSHGRKALAQVQEPNTPGGIVNINPIVNWNTQDVWDYIRFHELPYNRLYDQGYRSIGCESCTRAVRPGEDDRSGRWWWEEDSKKECGIFQEPGGDGI